MKIERISENQIRCTLSKHDLMERHLKISELAYGSDKAKELFRDMMEQANIDLGFDADDIPLMIEAIPTSRESIVLVITKVDNPEEFDERFSRFGLNPENGEFMDDEDGEFDETLEDTLPSEEPSEIVNCFEQLHELLEEAGAKAEAEFVPLSESLQGKKKQGKAKKKQQESIRDSVHAYSFDSLNVLISLAHMVHPQYTAKNTIWKDPVHKRYYLMVNRGQGKAVYQSVCSLLSEYGKEEPVTYATQAYYNEHFKLILKDNALSQLGEIQIKKEKRSKLI